MHFRHRQMDRQTDRRTGIIYVTSGAKNAKKTVNSYRQQRQSIHASLWKVLFTSSDAKWYALSDVIKASFYICNMPLTDISVIAWEGT